MVERTKLPETQKTSILTTVGQGQDEESGQSQPPRIPILIKRPLPCTGFSGLEPNPHQPSWLDEYLCSPGLLIKAQFTSLPHLS